VIDLKESLEMFEKNPLSQAVTDADMKIILVNEAFIKMTGFSRDRLLAIRFSDFRDKGMIKYLENTGESVVEAISTRRTTYGQSTLETPSGSTL
jgi:methyl-accepting chemotaxis protein